MAFEIRDPRVKDAYDQGRRACVEQGLRFDQNPHRSGDDAPGSLSASLSFAWKKGFQAGEVEQAEGQHFKTTRG